MWRNNDKNNVKHFSFCNHNFSICCLVTTLLLKFPHFIAFSSVIFISVSILESQWVQEKMKVSIKNRHKQKAQDITISYCKIIKMCAHRHNAKSQPREKIEPKITRKRNRYSVESLRVSSFIHFCQQIT